MIFYYFVWKILFDNVPNRRWSGELPRWAGAHQIWGPTWIFSKKRFTFSLGRGVGHVPGEHKPHFRHFQTHSFSENKKKRKSSKYKYIFGPKKVGGKSKIHAQIGHLPHIRHLPRRISGHLKQIVFIPQNNHVSFCVIFFHLSKIISETLYLV